MPKIAFVGAGSFGFTRNLVRDILTFPALADSTIALMDIDRERLDFIRKGVDRIVEAGNYPDTAIKALKRMYYQKGSTLHTDREGRAENGMLIRHLVLPGHVEESKKVLRVLAEELSTGVHISLMSQYHPVPLVKRHPVLDRPLYKAEYEAVAEAMENLGFRNGWVQDMESYLNYRPDFSREHPFE